MPISILDSMFWDSVEIEVIAGSGGSGAVSFRTALGEAKGGPDGGDGGDGGNVVVVADRNLNTLVDYARTRVYKASSGEPGAKAKRHGKSADDLVLRVPVGTMIVEGERVLADLANEGAKHVVTEGGRGGFGNAHFTASTRQTPRHAELGEPGEERHVKLELKLVADIGLVGIPSVGKSTLLSRYTAAKPKIADYPFTTTVPQLGIVTVDDARLVMVDIPGLIEGAHQGKGLGDAFLRHLERTKVILHVLDATTIDPVADYVKIRHELESFSLALVDKPELIAINKSDTLDEEMKALLVEDARQRLGQAVYLISAVSGDGLQAVLREAAKQVKGIQETNETSPMPVFTLEDLAPQALTIQKDGKKYIATGARIEQLATQTDFSNHQAAERFWWIFKKFGGEKRLEKLGATPGDTIFVGSKKIAWQRII